MKRPRGFKDGAKTRMMNDLGIFEYDVTIVSAEYDRERNRWMYDVNDCDRKPVKGKVEETKLGGEGED